MKTEQSWLSGTFQKWYCVYFNTKNIYYDNMLISCIQFGANYGSMKKISVNHSNFNRIQFIHCKTELYMALFFFNRGAVSPFPYTEIRWAGLRTRVAVHGSCCFYQLSYRLLPYGFVYLLCHIQPIVVCWNQDQF
jgi:hypothetical protein